MKSIAALLLPCAAAALAAPVTPPKLRAGMWELVTSIPTLPAPYNKTSSTLCVDDAVQRRWSLLSANAAASGQCRPAAVQLQGGVYRFSQSCAAGGRTITTSGTVLGDFQSRYAMTARSTGMPGPATTISATGRHLGACKGLRPGQMRVMGQVVPL